MLFSKFTAAALIFVGIIFLFAKTPDLATINDRALAEEYCAEKGGSPPKQFTSDVCSRWPDGGWGKCCMKHDIKYWCGGGAAERLIADNELRTCVNEIKPGMGTLMFWGIRSGAASWLPTPYRWGYGWPWPDPGY